MNVGLGLMPPLPVFSALSAAQQATATAITEIPAQRSRLNFEWSQYNGFAESYADAIGQGRAIPPQSLAAMKAWRERLDEAEGKQAQAEGLLFRAYGAATGVLQSAGLAAFPVIAVGIAAAVVIVAAGLVGIEFYTAYTAARVALEDATQRRGFNQDIFNRWSLANEQSISQGAGPLAPPQLYDPPKPSASGSLGKSLEGLGYAAVAVALIWGATKAFGGKRGAA